MTHPAASPGALLEVWSMFKKNLQSKIVVLTISSFRNKEGYDILYDQYDITFHDQYGINNSGKHIAYSITSYWINITQSKYYATHN